MTDENDSTDYRLVVRPSRDDRPSRDEMTPAMAERTPAEEEEHAELDKLEEELTKLRLEEISRESDLLFQDDVWITQHALALIAFKDKRRIVDDSWRSPRPLTPAPVETNPRKVLWQWLIDGKTAASVNGEEKSPRFWDSVEHYQLLSTFPKACFRRDDLVKLVFGGEASPKAQVAPGKSPVPPTVHASRSRGPRPRKLELVLEAMRDDIAAGVDLKDMLEKGMAAKYAASRDTCRKARNIALTPASTNSDKQSPNDK
jgi:hypothetical protein